MEHTDELHYFYEGTPTIPAFCERSFILGS